MKNVKESLPHKMALQATLGLLQGWQDIEAMVILSLLCFIWAERIPIAIGIGLLFVNLYFYIFNQPR